MNQKFNYIETLLAWKGTVHAGEVADYFKVARQTAQGFISDYKKAYPGQMRYDPKLKRHVRSDDFQHELTNEKSMFYLDFIRGEKLVGHFYAAETISEIPLVDVDRLARPKLSPDITRAVLMGITHRKRVSILYQSKAIDPKAVDFRIISPNRLVHADNRYHVRAYYHKTHVYRDFVLSRIQFAELQSSEKPESEWVSGDEDKDWHAQIVLRFYPNPKLTEAQKQAIVEGYELDGDNYYTVKTSRALAYYVKRKMLSMDTTISMPRWCLCNSF